MNDAQRQLLYDRLMQGAEEQCQGDVQALKIFADSTLEDLDAIEPLIDQMISAAVNDALARCGKMQDGELGISVLPDGEERIVFVDFEGKQFHVHIARTRLRDIGKMLLEES